ncbi:MAG: hypothetical protein HOE62_01540 [Alphaproteobacteria bacterium]|jgi:hypothetical protein|nr:hypothetical protein [Alphaproteobacteria bacterium]
MSRHTPELVSCNVHVSPKLARRIRKASQAEQSGQEAIDALLIAADCKPGETEQLQSQVAELSLALEASEVDQATLKSTVAQLKSELSDLRAVHEKLDFANEKIAALDLALTRSINLDGFSEKAAVMFRSIAEKLSAGGDSDNILLAEAGYDRDKVDAVISMIEPLNESVAKLEAELIPQRRVLASDGLKAWIARRLLG